MAKMSKAILKVMSEQIMVAVHNASIIARINNNCPYLPSRFKDKPVSYYEGMLDATYATIDSLLHAHKIYQGYNDFQFSNKHGSMIASTVRKYYGNQIHEAYKEAFAEYADPDKAIRMASPEQEK